MPEDSLVPRSEANMGATPVQERTLHSWKEVASYIGRGIRTVQRWEKQLNLPVHRVGDKGEVFARAHEIDAWFASFARNEKNQDGDGKNWREIAERASQEEDPEKLMSLINELNHLLSEKEVKANKPRPRLFKSNPFHNAA